MKKLSLLGVAIIAVAVVVLLALTPGVSLAVLSVPSDVVTVSGFTSFRFEDTEPTDGFLIVPAPENLPGTNQALLGFLEPSFEPCSYQPTIPQGCLSDVLLLEFFPTSGQHSIFLLSDDNVTNMESALLFTADRLSIVPQFLTETGFHQDVTLLLGLDASQVTVTVQSDVLQSNVVPECPTWLLVGLGVVGLVAWRRKQLRPVTFTARPT